MLLARFILVLTCVTVFASARPQDYSDDYGEIYRYYDDYDGAYDDYAYNEEGDYAYENEDETTTTTTTTTTPTTARVYRRRRPTSPSRPDQGSWYENRRR